MPWIRSGDCPPEQCKGRCCKEVGVWFDVTAETRPFLDALEVRGHRIGVMEGGKALAMLPAKCQWLTGRGRCQLHPDMHPSLNFPQRPAFCNDWPTEPSQILAHDCGFSFEWAEDEEVNLASAS